MTEPGQRGGGVDFEGADRVVFATVNAGVGAVAGIEQAPQFGEEMEVRVQFVEQEGGLMLVGDAVQDGGFQVVGSEDLGAHGGEEVERGGFAATGAGGSEVEARAMGSKEQPSSNQGGIDKIMA
jgi:hypothetical protein